MKAVVSVLGKDSVGTVSYTHLKAYLLKTLDTCPSSVSELVVIHGSNHGDKLAQLVRKQIKHPRISKIFLTMNPGETILELKAVKTGIKK